MNLPIIQYAIALLVFCGVLSFSGLVSQVVLSKNRARMITVTRGLAGVGSLLLFAALAVLVFEYTENQGQSFAWQVGWIWPRQESGALHAGIYIDGIALIFSAIGILSAAVYGVLTPAANFSAFPVFMGLLGVCLSWYSLTVWGVLGGIFISAWAGFFEKRRCDGVSEQSGIATQYLVGRLFGIGLVLIGASLLLSEGHLEDFSVLLEDAPVTTRVLGTKGEVGVMLFWLGLFSQLQLFPMPLSENIKGPAGITGLVDLIITRLFPALCAFAGFTKARILFQQSEFSQLFFALGCFAVVMTVILGLYQRSIKYSLGLGTAMGFMLAAGLMSVNQGEGLLAGLYLGAGSALALLFALVLLQFVTAAQRGWRYLGLYFLVFGPGGVGFLGLFLSLGCFRDDPLLMSGMILSVVSLSVFQGRWSWAQANFESLEKNQSWKAVVGTIVGLFLQLAIFWVGHPLGLSLAGEGVIFSGVFGGIRSVVGTGVLNSFDPTLFFGLVGAQAAGLTFGVWSESSRRSIWNDQGERGGKWVTLLNRNFGLVFLWNHFYQTLSWVGSKTILLMDTILWDRGIRFFNNIILLKGSRYAARLLSFPVEAANELGFRLVNVPGKFLQLVQNGDVQWYLLFGLSVLAAVLIQILKG